MSTSGGWAEKEDPAMTFEKPLEREREWCQRKLMRACLVVKYDRLKIPFKFIDIKAIDDLGKNNLCGLVGVESE